jgi:osmotically-inducible protein OsmY
MTIPMPSGPGDASAGRPSRRPVPRWSDDQQIAASVVARLVGNERTCEEPIAVEVQNRVAILTGRVDEPDAAVAAGFLAWQTPGVADVCNAIEVRGEG